MSIKIYPFHLTESGRHNAHAKLAFFSEFAAPASLCNGVAGGLQISKKCIDRVPLARASGWVGKGLRQEPPRCFRRRYHDGRPPRRAAWRALSRRAVQDEDADIMDKIRGCSFGRGTRPMVRASMR